MPKRRHGAITWKVDPLTQVSGRHLHHRMQPQETPLNNEMRKVFESGVSNGQAFIVKELLEADPPLSDEKDGPVPRLRRGFDRSYDPNWNPRTSCVACPGDLAMYAGEVRVDERTVKREDIRRIRHTFVVGNGRYIIPDLNVLVPL